MSLNFDHDLEYCPSQDNEFISFDQDLYSTLFLGQCGALESVVDPRPIHFEDFILFPEESDEEESPFEPSSVLETSGETRTDQIYDEAESMLTWPTNAVMLQLFSDSWSQMDAHTEQLLLSAADGLSNSQNLVDISSACASAPREIFQRADALDSEHSTESESTSDSSQELSEPLSGSRRESADHKRCVPRVRFFNCPACAHVFNSQARLRTHTRQTHAPRRFSCECGKMFHMRKDLRRHEATHKGGPRDFVCTCDKTYLRRDHLLRHISNMEKKHDIGYHKAVTALPQTTYNCG